MEIKKYFLLFLSLIILLIFLAIFSLYKNESIKTFEQSFGDDVFQYAFPDIDVLLKNTQTSSAKSGRVGFVTVGKNINKLFIYLAMAANPMELEMSNAISSDKALSIKIKDENSNIIKFEANKVSWYEPLYFLLDSSYSKTQIVEHGLIFIDIPDDIHEKILKISDSAKKVKIICSFENGEKYYGYKAINKAKECYPLFIIENHLKLIEKDSKKHLNDLAKMWDKSYCSSKKLNTASLKFLKEYIDKYSSSENERDSTLKIIISQEE